MGSGKSTIGYKLAKNLNYAYVDLDYLIEEKYRITIPDLFAKYDEGAFRKLEKETLQETFDLSTTVISTGGGTPCFYENMKLINKNGLSVYIKLNPITLNERLLKSKKKRPLIAKKTPEEILEHINIQLAAREFYYNQSKMIIDGLSIDIDQLSNSIKNLNT